MLRPVACLLVTAFLFSCSSRSTKFVTVPGSESGIHFNNTITETDSINVLDLENVYNGGGVGVGDFNQDGKQDLYFTGNLVSNKLYLNKGEMKFTDVSTEAGVTGNGSWSRGVAVVDINNDGKQDIYVSTTLSHDVNKRKNLLYINTGNDKKASRIFLKWPLNTG
jgi:hypothetical protein